MWEVDRFNLIRSSLELLVILNCQNPDNFVWSFQCKIRIDEKNKLNDMWFFKSILHAKKTKERNIIFAARKNQIVNWAMTHSEKQIVAFITIEFFFSKKKFSSFLNTKIMCLEINNYTIQKSLSKRLFSSKSNVTIFSFTTHRRSVSVFQVNSSQKINNALTILRYKSFEKKSRERFKQQYADNITTINTQNEKLWIYNVHYSYYNTVESY
jgi:hypothetical protein